MNSESMAAFSREFATSPYRALSDYRQAIFIPRPRNLGRVPHLFGEVSEKSMAALLVERAYAP